MSRRFKSGPYVRRQYVAFAVIGEPYPVMDHYILPVWYHDDDEPTQLHCDTLEVVARVKEEIRLNNMEDYEAAQGSVPA